MFSQIALGAALTLSTIVLGSLSLYLLEGALMEGVRDLRLRQTRRHGRRARSETDPAVPDDGGVERH